MVISHLNDYFERNDEPILKNEIKKDKITNNDNETISKIIEVLDTKIRASCGKRWRRYKI